MAKPQVRWTDEEQERLTDLVYGMRRKSPELSIVALTQRAQEQLPANRRRTIQTHQMIAGIVSRLKAKEQAIADAAERCREVESRLTFFHDLPKTTAAMLAAVSDIELKQHCLARVLGLATPDEIGAAFPPDALLACVPTARLVGYVAERLFLELAERKPADVRLPAELLKVFANGHASNGHASNGNGRPARLPRVCIVGVKGDQPRVIAERLGGRAELNFIEAAKFSGDALPTSADHVFLWARFVSHCHCEAVKKAINPSKISTHHGGIEKLCEKILSVLSK